MTQSAMSQIEKQFKICALMLRAAMGQNYEIKPYVDAIENEMKVIAQMLAQIPIEDKTDE